MGLVLLCRKRIMPWQAKQAVRPKQTETKETKMVNASNTKTSGKTEDSNKSAPSEVASREGSSAPNETMAAARKKRADEMSVANGKKTAEGKATKEEKKPSFVVDEKVREELRGMSNEALLAAAGDQLRPVDKANTDIYQATGNTKDHLNGQLIERSPIRAEVVAFLESRKDHSAPANVICAYMALATGKCYKGKFNFGYITTKDGDAGKRGMVARKFLRMTEKGTPPSEPANA